MNLDKMLDLNDDDVYRFHMAKPAPSGARPLDSLARSKDAWLGWQVYRGKAKERFVKDLVVTFAQIDGSKFPKVVGRGTAKMSERLL